MVKTLSSKAGAQVRSLVRELRSHMLHGEEKKKKKKKMLEIHCNGNTQGEQDRITKTAWRKTFRVKHKIRLVCRILQMAHSTPTTTQVDCMMTMHLCLITVLLFLSTPSGMWNPSFLTRDQSHVPFSVLTTEPPGKSSEVTVLTEL